MEDNSTTSRQIPKMIAGKYEVLAEIGRGGFGAVYKARNATLNKIVAIKILHGSLSLDAVTRARFEQEAKAGANLAHPNVVSVFDYGFTDDGYPFLVMEFVEGTNLEEFLKKNLVPPDELLNLLSQTAKALRYLHDCNIIHRDIKTSNILVQEIGGERYARILDLGIAKVFSPTAEKEHGTLTSTGMIFGSPAFMSPEQCEGKQIDARSDVYSFGCVIYQCVSGELPFSGENSLQIILKHLNEPPPPLKCKTERDQQMAEVVSKCMEKDPAKRYQNMKEVLDALQRCSYISPNEKTHMAPNSLSRSYIRINQPEPPPAAEPTPGMTNFVYGFLVVMFILILIPLGAMLYSNISRSMANSAAPPPAAVVPVAAPAVAVPPPRAPVQSPPPVATTPAMPNIAEQQAAERLRAEQLILEQQRITLEKLKLENEATARENQEKDKELAKQKQLEEYVKIQSAIKVQALGAASDETFKAVTQQLRALDQPAQSLHNSAAAMRRMSTQSYGIQQYNDDLAKRNNLRH